MKKFDDGTHIIHLSILGVKLKKFKESLQKRNIDISNPDKEGFWLRINPSSNRKTAEEMAGFFEEAYEESKI